MYSDVPAGSPETRPLPSSTMDEAGVRLAMDAAPRWLGWMNLLFGVSELMAPRAVSRMLGADLQPGFVRLLGVRDIAIGRALLTSRQPARWLWGRVVSDGFDLLMLAATRSRPSVPSWRRAAVLAGAVSMTWVDLNAAVRHTPLPSPEPSDGPIPGTAPRPGSAPHDGPALRIRSVR